MNKPLAVAYYLKEDLRRFWEQPGKRFATAFLNGWLRRAEASGVKVLQQMAKTLAGHRSGLLAYFDVMITSASTGTSAASASGTGASSGASSPTSRPSWPSIDAVS